MVGFMSLSNQHGSYQARAVTPSDTVDLVPGVCDAIMAVTTTGDVVVITDFGETLTFKSVPLMTVIPIRCTRIKATSTTATGIVALRFGTW